MLLSSHLKLIWNDRWKSGKERFAKNWGEFWVDSGEEDQDTIFQRKNWFFFFCLHLYSKHTLSSKLYYLHLHEKGRAKRIFKPKFLRLCNACIFQKLSLHVQSSHNVWGLPVMCMQEVSTLYFFAKDGNYCYHLKLTSPSFPCGVWGKLDPPRMGLYLGPLHNYVTR